MSGTANTATLGIIGGAGVGAAARLYADVSFAHRTHTGALPRVLLWNIPLDDDIERGFTKRTPEPAALAAAEALVAEAVQRLADGGASVIAMPCNSLQRVAAQECERAGIPFIDMIASTVEAARAQGSSAAVLLATEATAGAGFYDGHGVEMIAPPAPLQEELNAIIHAAVAGSGEPQALASLLERARRPQIPTILGCTDICALIEPDPAVVESLGCLTARCVEVLSSAAAIAA
ncbi:MAG TPA: aspartate/glutamate racemase family protein [Solirubrobacteraceae bacterium]|nr:aspartate/glutamate racemase family protein [Solirubrobacteraceae bacterium]